MASALSDPEIGSWYRDIQDRVFAVVAIDDEDTIEVQYYDGDVAEFDRETWDLLCVSGIAEPNDGLGPYEEIPEDEFNEVSELLKPVSWDNISGEVEG
jgi:hypothetical protein